ncbi:hypothetical protein D3C80_1833640 [compost metagenome]
MPACGRTECVDKGGSGINKTGAAGHRIDQHAGDAVTQGVQTSFKSVDVVETNEMDVIGDTCRRAMIGRHCPRYLCLVVWV